MGQRHYLKNKLNRSKEIFQRYSPKWQWYYLEINPFSCVITLKYNILKAAVSSEISYDIKTFFLDEKEIAFSHSSSIFIKAITQVSSGFNTLTYYHLNSQI